jgi:hypothetical protein
VLLGACICSAPHSFAQREHQPTSEQKAALKSFLERVNGKAITYEAAFVDLQDNGVQEVIVYFTDQGSCGTGGCDALILEPSGSSYKTIAEITLVHSPIRVLRSKSHGWHDITVVVVGGGLQPGYEAKLSFDGKTYPDNPSIAPAQPLSTKATGIVAVPGFVIRRPHATESKSSELETIVPSESVGKMHLGMKKSELDRPIFAWKATPSFVAPNGSCGQVAVHWLGDQTGVTAYLVDDSVYQIDAPTGAPFTVQNMRLSANTKLSELRKMMPDGTLLRWVGSAFLSPSGKDVEFWVNVDKGIAFRLDYDLFDARIHKLKSRIVGSVSVFRAGTKFQPEGCLDPSQSLVPVEKSDAKTQD